MSTKQISIVCPKCGSNNINVELRSAGANTNSRYYKTGVNKSWVIPAGKKSVESNMRYKSIAICQNCGNYWTVKEDDSYLGTIIALFFIFVLIFGLLRSYADDFADKKSNGGLIWATEYTPIEDFDYYIDGDYLYLKDCNSHSRTIYIAPQYEIDGRVLTVKALEGGRFFNHAKSIIISEGITSIDYAVFNGCDVKYVYLPSTLENFSGFNFFHNGEKLYYGGNETAWSELFTGERRNLDFVEIICNASIEDLVGN